MDTEHRNDLLISGLNREGIKFLSILDKKKLIFKNLILAHFLNYFMILGDISEKKFGKLWNILIKEMYFRILGKMDVNFCEMGFLSTCGKSNRRLNTVRLL